MFRDYRQAYDEMEANQEIQITRQVIISTKERLAELEKPYRDRIAQAQEEITKAVLQSKKTTTLFGVIAKFFKPRRSTAWKSVAQAMDPPQDLIDKFTKYGEPRVQVSVV